MEKSFFEYFELSSRNVNLACKHRNFVMNTFFGFRLRSIGMITSGDEKCLQFAVTSGRNDLKFLGY
jgi:hypothetical protein